MNCPTLRFFGTFGVFGELVRIQVEYRMLRGTQVRDVRLYEPGLNQTPQQKTEPQRLRLHIRLTSQRQQHTESRGGQPANTCHHTYRHQITKRKTHDRQSRVGCHHRSPKKGKHNRLPQNTHRQLILHKHNKKLHNRPIII